MREDIKSLYLGPLQNYSGVICSLHLIPSLRLVFSWFAFAEKFKPQPSRVRWSASSVLNSCFLAPRGSEKSRHLVNGQICMSKFTEVLRYEEALHRFTLPQWINPLIEEIHWKLINSALKFSCYEGWIDRTLRTQPRSQDLMWGHLILLKTFRTNLRRVIIQRLKDSCVNIPSLWQNFA